MPRENAYQPGLIERIELRWPGCMVIKLDSGYMQGIPDLLILFGRRWAILEVKKSAKADAEPNQPYYVDLFNKMSFSAFIYPENEVEVLDALGRSFEHC